MSTEQISPKLEARLLQETKADIIAIMLEAIDSMQAYNGRSTTWCIVDALGGKANENDDGVISSYSYPKFKRKNKNG